MLEKSKYYWGGLMLLMSIFMVYNCRPKGGEEVSPIDSTAISSCILLSEKANGVLQRAYEYDSSRYLTRMLEYSGTEQSNKIVKRYTFEYAPKHKLLRFRETNLAVKDMNYIYELDYLNSTQLKAIRVLRVFNSGPRPEDTIGVLYDTNRRITELKSGARQITAKWEYDSAGNTKKWFVRGPLMTSDSLLAEYSSFDDKVNIYAFSEGVQLVNFLLGRAHSKRNPLIYNLLGQNTEVTYQYNDKRVPTQAVVKSKSANNVLRETVYTYELNCK